MDGDASSFFFLSLSLSLHEEREQGAAVAAAAALGRHAHFNTSNFSILPRPPGIARDSARRNDAPLLIYRLARYARTSTRGIDTRVRVSAVPRLAQGGT